jgi:V/A-type H+-transporting ATPase subunit E
VGAEALLNEVEEKRRRAIEELEREYEVKKSQLREGTEARKRSILDAASSRAQAQASRERTRVVGAAKLEAKKLIFEATEKMLEQNLAQLKEVLADYSRTAEYKNLLSAMLRHAVSRLGEDCTVSCRQPDGNILRELGAKISSSDLQTIGGFKVASKDGTLELDLTFEELLRSHDDDIRAALLEVK